MLALADLVDAMERAFAVTRGGLRSWPDPHPDRSPRDDEYSRVTDGDRWRLLGARADAWLDVLEAADIARVDRSADVRWVDETWPPLSRQRRAEPRRPGALALVVGRSTVGDVEGAGVTFGLGDPALRVAWFPHCGCDACDSGSQDELDQIDRLVTGVVSGTFRRLVSGRREITQVDPGGWSASGSFRRGEVEAVLARADGWQELSGAPWLDLA